MNGLFITIEGPDGAGKSTLVKKLQTAVAAETKRPLVITREPGGSEIAEEIRDIILNPLHTKMDARTEALLLAAGRRQHVVEKIRPALERGEIVLCDRFVDSSVAYQGQGRGIGMDKVIAINAFAVEDLKPDITLYLDIASDEGLKRIKSKHSNRKQDRLELEEITFHEKVREGYEQLIEEDPNRFSRIDASQVPAKVFEDAWAILKPRLK
ncbi:Thymidylate kinase [Alkalibacterium sp. AK22]|uniref:dTMP kinase n=1 Tax=Alkalibacterium sp. AK22 TaxID=1229520 RepID=UPI000451B01D|nr:dTMP kinase [Alkalibacterium sp. AK22]EXJ23694.1 Thymidylate kinase [Alkalibacterium sp. AK22]